MLIMHIVGARPNFMKVAPVMAALEQAGNNSQLLVHTGQHYDANMSEIFFQQLGLPEPDINLEVGSGSHAWQTAQVMIRFEEVLLAESPDLVLVYGDVNSTVAASLVCSKLGVPVGHVEAGLRSFDRSMPEEINRIVTDRLSSFLFTPSEDGDENLLREGVEPERVHCVGNVMIDTLIRLQKQAAERWPALSNSLNVTEPFGLVTLHRPSNVDQSRALVNILNTLVELSNEIPLVFPIHPRTHQQLVQMAWRPTDGCIHLTNPLGYLDFMSLMQHTTLVITDSGGIQEETTYLSIPCITVRENTERPVTVTIGTNILVGTDMSQLRTEVQQILNGNSKQGRIPPLWDGKAGERIAAIILNKSG